MQLDKIVRLLALKDSTADFGKWFDANETALTEELGELLPKKKIFDAWAAIRAERSKLSSLKETWKASRDDVDLEDPDFYNGDHASISFRVTADALTNKVNDAELRHILDSKQFTQELERRVALALTEALRAAWGNRDFSKVIDVDEVTVRDVVGRVIPEGDVIDG